jgi:Xaa-Pro aminopeptidase
MLKRGPKFILLFALFLTCGIPGGADPAGKLFGQTPEEFSSRRAALRAAVKGVILLFAQGEGPDIDRGRYRTSNSMMYLTGVEAPRAVLALLPEGDPSGSKEILFLPAQSSFSRQWVDPVPGPDEETRKATGIQRLEDVRKFWDLISPSLAKAESVHFEGPVGDAPSRSSGRFGLGAKYSQNGAAEEKVKSLNPSAKISGGVEREINKLRFVKSPGEIANLKGAIAATGAAQIAAARAIQKGVTELAVEGPIIAEFRKGGAVREGFPSIVGAGPNSIILHHFSSMRPMQANETVVVDIGAEYNYYSADVTRTFPVGGKFTQRQRELYQLVLDTQTACAKQVVPGKTTLGELNRFAKEFMRKSPLRAKDANGNKVTMDNFFIHGLSHWLGMDVHDVGGATPNLIPGTVFTIEPGVYIPSEGIGIRIEDDYLTTESGLEKLSGGIPSTVAEIESLMRK